jgi:alpha-amylase
MEYFRRRFSSPPPRSLHHEYHEPSRDVTIFQAFEWYVPADLRHWQRLRAILGQLKDLGIDHIWLPPACKASSPASNGYDVYDLYDLGEFDWKMSRDTKWGSKKDLLAFAQEAQRLGIGLLWDAVLSHRAAADFPETVTAVEVDPTDRRKDVSGPKEIKAWVGYNFPGRKGKYSTQEYHR